MPTYEYQCPDCDHLFEKFQSITAKPIRKCPVCLRRRVRRLIGAGAGLIFRGSGFYQTDYRSEGYQKAATAEKEAAKPKAKSDDGKKSSTTNVNEKPKKKADKKS